MKLPQSKVLVIGLGKSGVAAAEKLNSLGATVIATDSSTGAEIKKAALSLKNRGIKIYLGEHDCSLLNEIDLIVVSPGIPIRTPILKEAKKRKVLIWSEVELAYRLTDSKIIGITGTNGKTTTTTLIGSILKQGGYAVIVAGNIGFPLVKAIDEATRETTIVTELSSFQLETIVEFHPFISVLLNITEDHLDWHTDFKDYAEAKARIFLNQTTDDYAVINYDDEVVRNVSSKVRANLVPLSKRVRLANGIYLKDSKIIAGFKGDLEICRAEELKIKGEHNLDNAMASVGAALVAGVDKDDIRKALVAFEGLKHRIEFVATVGDVAFYNDSKATNPDATVKALTAFDSPIILLLGGRSKGNSFEPIAKVIDEKVRKVVVFGESEKEIKETLKNHSVEILSVRDLKEAVEVAYAQTQPEDVVLLSPACASFDMFSNYKERGEVFKRAVLALKERVNA